MPSEKPDTQAQSLEGYRGNALKLLQRFGLSTGSRISLKTKEGFEASGILVPRYEHADSEHIVIKLKSGYNIGFSAESVESLAFVEGESASVFGRARLPEPLPSTEIRGVRTVHLLSTGGTIASRVDYRTGAVHPALTAEDLYVAIPELNEIAIVKPEVVFSTYSENITPNHWEQLSQRITELSSKSKTDGIVIMLGTDTMTYVSAALSFSLLGLSVPVVCVGAQRSSDRPSSDAALNLKAATRFATQSGMSGIYVSMHRSESDDFVAIHSGVRVRKNHTSRRDAFVSVDSPYVALVRDKEILMEKYQRPSIDQIDRKFLCRTKFEDKVALLKFYPGFDVSILDHLKNQGIRGIILEGTGLGHVSSNTIEKIKVLCLSGVFVGITSQCVSGHVDLNVYETGRDLLLAGAISLENMLGETAYSKLSWALGNFPGEETKEIMLTNFAGEFSKKISLT